FGVVVCRAVATTTVAAQAVPEQGGILGEVVDASTTAPIAGATVTLGRRAGVAAGTTIASRLLANLRSVVTDTTGGYRFSNLPFGDYRLSVRRIGYRSV